MSVEYMLIVVENMQRFSSWAYKKKKKNTDGYFCKDDKINT